MKDRDIDVARDAALSHGQEAGLLTYDDYLQTPDDIRYELLEGVLKMTPAPNTRHQTILKRLSFALVDQLENRGLGQVFIAPTDVVLSKHNVVQPDILFIAKEHLGIIGEACIKGTPDLVIEVLSPATVSRDRVIKRRIYSQFGAREYWLPDPTEKTIEVAALSSDKETPSRVYHVGDTALSMLFPDLRVDTATLFAE